MDDSCELSFTPVNDTDGPAPWLSYYAIGGHNYNDSAWQAWAATRGVGVVVPYRGWDAGHGTTMAACIANVRALAPAALGTLNITGYLIYDEAYATGYVADRLNAQNQWLYQSGTSGAKVPYPWGTQYVTNWTDYCNAGSDGDKFNVWFNKDGVAMIKNGNAFGNSANPNLSGPFYDTVSPYPIFSGPCDFERDGTSATANYGSSPASIINAMRAGHRAIVTDMRSRWGSACYVMGNTNNYEYVATGEDPSVLGDLNQLYNGGMLEGFWDEADPTSSFSSGMHAMRVQKACFLEPKHLIAIHSRLTSTSYKSARYALGMCLLNTAWYCPTTEAPGYGHSTSTRMNFDEFDKGDGSWGYLDQPDNTYGYGAIQTAAWSGTVWRRDFDNGSVFVNPYGASSTTFNCPFNGHRITGNSGRSDTAINTGAAVSSGASVSLTARDAIVILRP